MSAINHALHDQQDDDDEPLLDKDFHHPYTPYDVQKQFMSAVYQCLVERKVGILESPTGTGKSLSLICGSLTWLRDWKRKTFEQGLVEGQEDADGEPDWILASAREQKRRVLLQDRADREARLARVREKEDRARQRYENGEPPAKRQKTKESAQTEKDEEADFLLDDYYSDDEKPAQTKQKTTALDALSAETQALLAQYNGAPDKRTAENEDELEDELKIFYCSRTHSQITQFVNELRRVKLPPSVPPDPDDPATDLKISSKNTSKAAQEGTAVEELKHLTLGSRKNLCINPKVSKLNSTTSINERCLELQQPGTPKDKKCPYLPSKDNEVLVNDFRDHALAHIRDIEDFGKLGKKLGVCPYYATRAAVKPAEIVTLPYPLLLQKTAREALNISLKGHIVIFDEAHNLMDAIANIHSVSLSLSQLKLARAQLGGYLLKFRNRLKGKNRVYVTQLVRLIDSLSGYLDVQFSNNAATDGRADISELMAGKGVDQINLYKLMRYLHESKLARKVERYAVFALGEDSSAAAKSHQSKVSTVSADKKQEQQAGMPVLTHLQSFLLALTYPAAEGRFFFERVPSSQDMLLKYLLLDPTHHFQDIVDEARAVVLAGGTMSPMSDYTSHLLPYLPPTRLLTLSCSHVIPPTNLLAMPISSGPTGIPFEFTFDKRGDERMVMELGRALLELCQVVPDGVVVFFPSYAYLDGVVASWRKQTGSASLSLWQQIEARKKIFMEPKSSTSTSASSTNTSTTSTKGTNTSSSDKPGTNTTTTSKIDALLSAYTSHIHSSTSGSGTNGALLLAVINGSLSEGINFSDRLGRCVVVVGLPFPNARGAEWQAKLEYVGARAAAGVGASDSVGNAGHPEKAHTKKSDNPPSAAARESEAAKREFYTNACMRSVNQSVGRAIRHKGDWATILLVDGRWERREELRGKLPGWIGRSLEMVGDAGGGGGGGGKWRRMRSRLEGFFEGKKSSGGS